MATTQVVLPVCIVCCGLCCLCFHSSLSLSLSGHSPFQVCCVYCVCVKINTVPQKSICMYTYKRKHTYTHAQRGQILKNNHRQNNALKLQQCCTVGRKLVTKKCKRKLKIELYFSANEVNSLDNLIFFFNIVDFQL